MLGTAAAFSRTICTVGLPIKLTSKKDFSTTCTLVATVEAAGQTTVVASNKGRFVF